MKILRLKLRNLNSLHGDFEIDFTKTPLAEAGLFLITGDTGAGKTTILDSITLALYGATPRSKGKPEDIVTFGCTEGYAEVEFAVGLVEYRARWVIRKRKSGDYETPKREIANLSNKAEILATKVKEVDDTVARVTGLDFKRFTRSVLLAQGEFVEFLKAGDERAAILERVTGTERYSEISKAAYDRFKSEKEKTELLKSTLDGVELLDEEQTTSINDELETLEIQLNEAKDTLSSSQETLVIYEAYHKLLEKKEKLESEFSNIKSTENELSNAFASLSQHEKAVVFQPELNLLDSLSKEIFYFKNDYETFLSEAKMSLEKSVLLKEKIVTHSLELENFTDKNKERNLLYDEITALDAKILTFKESFLIQKKEYFNFEATLQKLQNKLKEANEHHAELEENRQAMDTWFLQHATDEKLPEVIPVLENLEPQLRREQEEIKELDNKISKKKSEYQEFQKKLAKEKDTLLNLKAKLNEDRKKLEELIPDTLKRNDINVVIQLLRDKLEEKQSACNVLQQVLDVSRNYSKKRQLFLEKQEVINEYRASLNFEEEKLLVILDELDDAQKMLLKRKILHASQENIKNCEQYREELKPGDPCPVCFSTEHPFRNLSFTKEEIQSATMQALQDLEKAERNLEFKQKQKIWLLNHTEKLHTASETTEKELLRIEVEMKTLEAENRSLLSRAGKYAEYARTTLGQLKENVDLLAAQIEKEKNLIKTIDNLDHEIGKKEKILPEVEAGIRSFKESSENNLTATKELENYFINSQITINRLQKEIETLLVPFGIREKLTALVLDTLKKRKDTYLKAVQKRDKNKQERIETAEQIKQFSFALQTENEKDLKLKSSLDENEKELDALEKNRFEKFGTDNPAQKREQDELIINNLRAILKDHEIVLKENEQVIALAQQKAQDRLLSAAKKETEFANQTHNLLQKVQTVGFDDLESLTAAILPPDKAAEYHSSRNALQSRKDECDALLRDTAAEIEKHLPLLKESRTLDDLLLEIKQTSQNIEELLGSQHRLLERLEEDARRRQRHATLLYEIENQKAEFNRWSELNDLIGSANGDKFKKFAQGITLNRLVELANSYINSFTDGRYSLARRSADTLELDILDAYQANNQRPLITLSGGETFLASLSLALGLSDLAGKNADIQSLFIDEGFGSLDADTLKIAMHALLSLQAKGKNIGVISHVEEMKMSISTQIQVVKKGNGFSQLRIVP